MQLLLKLKIHEQSKDFLHKYQKWYVFHCHGSVHSDSVTDSGPASVHFVARTCLLLTDLSKVP